MNEISKILIIAAGLAMGIWAEGVDEAMTPYTVSKHGVVAMTRYIDIILYYAV